MFFDGVEQPLYSAEGVHLSKVLHWDITYHQLYHELIAKNFTITGSTTGSISSPFGRNKKAFVDDQSVFDGYPSSFLQRYAYIQHTGDVGLFYLQGMEVSMWDGLNNDLLTTLKRTVQWKTAAHSQK